MPPAVAEPDNAAFELHEVTSAVEAGPDVSTTDAEGVTGVQSCADAEVQAISVADLQIASDAYATPVADNKSDNISKGPSAAWAKLTALGPCMHCCVICARKQIHAVAGMKVASSCWILHRGCGPRHCSAAPRIQAISGY